MSSPDPESYSLLAKVLGAATAVVVPVWGARSWLEKRLGQKVSKDDFKEFCTRFDQHVRDDREIQAKLFDKIDDLKTTIIERIK